MTNKTDEWYLGQCLAHIENKLGWGPHTGWTNYDFEKLSQSISDATGVTLSISTLKRLWGKVAYKNVPSLTTLNTLAQFAGYEDWRALKQNGRQPEVEAPLQEQSPPLEPLPAPRRSRQPVYWAVGVVSLIASVYFLTSLKKYVRTPTPNDFTFSADKMVTSGLPNSVVFHYDATAALTDSVHIVQTWDINRKTLVPKDRHAHSAIYYYPGFFRTKLLADGKIMKTHDLLVGTHDWLALVEQQPTPLYIKHDEFSKDGFLEVDRNTLQSYNLPLHPSPPQVRFFYMKEMGNLMNDNFTFETSIKNEFDEGAAACQMVQVLIQCKDDIIIIPLSAKACVGNLSVYACGKALDARNTDLSRLGCDLNQWNKLKVQTVNKQMSIYVNDQLACSFAFPHDPTGIVGVQYRFDGPGAIKETRFTNKAEVFEF